MGRLPFWLHSTLKIWSYYLSISVASLPAAIVGLILMRNGISEPIAAAVSVSIALLLAVTLCRLYTRLSRVSSISQDNKATNVHVLITLGHKNVSVQITALPQRISERHTEVPARSVVNLGSNRHSQPAFRQFRLVA